MKLLPVVEVWWRDAEAGEAGWQTDDEAKGRKCPLVRSVGMLLEKTDQTLLLIVAHSDDQNNGRFRIPTSWIERILELRPASDHEIDVYGDFPM